MVKPDWKVEPYTTVDDVCPTEQFIDTLPVAAQKKCVWYLELLEQEGNTLNTDYAHHISGPIWELIADFGRTHYRFLYFFAAAGKIVVTHGFVKRTKKVEQKDIAFALGCHSDYYKRYPKG